MRIWILIGLLWTSFASVSAFAHSKEDENACRPDVYRLCASQIPNQNRIIACLTRNKNNLSSACYQVFDRAGRFGNGGSAAAPQSDGQRWGR